MTQQPLILVVDDEEAIVLGLVHRLQSAGYRTAGAYSGQEAIETALGLQPDLILLDQCLPELNGTAVLGELKRRRETRDIPVVLLSGAGMDHQEAIWSGAVAFLGKPYRRDELMELIESLLVEPASATDREPWRRRLF